MKPSKVSFEITEDCNFFCIHCYNHFRTAKTKKKNTDVTEKVLDRLIQEGIFQINFTGGEPFFRREFLFNAITKCLKNNIIPSINSNLSLIRKEDIPFLKNNNISIFFSYPSNDPETYEKIAQIKKPNVDKIILELIKAGVRITANIVVSKINLEDILPTGKHLASLGVKTIYVTPITTAFNNTISKKLMLSKKEYVQCFDDALLLKKENVTVKTSIPSPFCAFPNPEKFVDFFGTGCSYGQGTMVDQEGNVHACIAEQDTMGNILDNTFDEILKKKPHQKIIPEKCMACKSKHYCYKGCGLILKHFGKEFYGFPYYANKPLDYCFNPNKTTVKNIDFSKIKSFTISSSCAIRKKENNIHTIYNYNNNFSAQLNEEEFELFKILHANSNKLSEHFKQLDESVINKINKFLNYLYLNKIIDILFI